MSARFASVLAVALLASGISAADLGENTLRVSPPRQTLCGPGRATVDVLLDTTEKVSGWAFCLRIDPCECGDFIDVPDPYRICQIYPPPGLVTAEISPDGCELAVGVVLDFMGARTIGPGEDILLNSVEVEMTCAGEVCLSSGCGSPPVVPVVVVDGMSVAPEIAPGCAEIDISAISGLTCALDELACGAWRVILDWTCCPGIDAVRLYEDGVLAGEFAGCGGRGIAYGYEAGPIELGVEGVIDGVPCGMRSCLVEIPSSRSGFIRGDANQDGDVDIADAIWMLAAVFQSGWLACPAAADGNGDGRVDIADPIHLLEYIFQKGTPPPAPFPDCGWPAGPGPFDCP
ncbi:MAG: dockerin type I repeat-containing protein [Planctomycetes bacterium]|nr:dockerin type I repeat-containing protein [Planctomycetota bacterium]